MLPTRLADILEYTVTYTVVQLSSTFWNPIDWVNQWLRQLMIVVFNTC